MANGTKDVAWRLAGLAEPSQGRYNWWAGRSMARVIRVSMAVIDSLIPRKRRRRRERSRKKGLIRGVVRAGEKRGVETCVRRVSQVSRRVPSDAAARTGYSRLARHQNDRQVLIHITWREVADGPVWVQSRPAAVPSRHRSIHYSAGTRRY